MIKKPTLAEIMEERHSLLDSHRCLVTPEMESKRVVLEDLLEKLSKNGCSSYNLLDMNKAHFSVHFSTHSGKLKSPVILATDKNNWRNSLRHRHHDDLYHCCKSDILYYRHLMSLPMEDRHQLCMLNLGRLQNKDDSYDIYIFRTTVIESDALGMPCLLLTKIDYLFKCKTENFYPIRQYLLLCKGSNLIAKRLDAQNDNALTKQQLGVLIDIMNEKTIKQSADHFSISVGTVNDHRGDIRDKLNSITSAQVYLIVYWMRLIEPTANDSE